MPDASAQPSRFKEARIERNCSGCHERSPEGPKDLLAGLSDILPLITPGCGRRSPKPAQEGFVMIEEEYKTHAACALVSAPAKRLRPPFGVEPQTRRIWPVRTAL